MRIVYKNLFSRLQVDIADISIVLPLPLNIAIISTVEKFPSL